MPALSPIKLIFGENGQGNHPVPYPHHSVALSTTRGTLSSQAGAITRPPEKGVLPITLIHALNNTTTGPVSGWERLVPTCWHVPIHAFIGLNLPKNNLLRTASRCQCLANPYTLPHSPRRRATCHHGRRGSPRIGRKSCFRYLFPRSGPQGALQKLHRTRVDRSWLR